MYELAHRCFAYIYACRSDCGLRGCYRLTDFGHDTSQDDLSLARGFDRGTELGVVPGIGLAVASDVGGIGVHVRDLFWQWSIGSWRLNISTMYDHHHHHRQEREREGRYRFRPRW